MSPLKRIAERGGRALFLSGKYLYWKTHPVPTANKKHLFVAGVQRSGTNMLMDILEKSWMTDAYHERDSRAFDNYKMRDLEVIRRLEQASPMPLFVIKALFELQDLPQLMDSFQPAKTLWIVRNPYDTVNSTMKSFLHSLVKRINRAVDPEGNDWFGAGMSEQTRQTVAPLVHPSMAAEDAAALQWYIRNILFFEMGFDKDERVLPISYENLVTAPDEQIRRACDFIGIPFSPRLSRGIFSSSIGKRKKPALSPPVEALCNDLEERFRSLV